MKRIIFISFLLTILTKLHAQTPWYTVGNNTTIPNNIFGTVGQNTPIDFRTFNVQRAWLNANVTNNINSQGNAARNGYLGLGLSYSTGSWNTFGPYSLLHLNGDEGTFAQTFGYRNWMKNGITFTNNNDLGFMGIRKLSTKINKLDIPEMTLL